MSETGEDPMPDDEAVSEAREVVIDAFERSAQLYGLNRSYGRLYGILYFADGPLSLDDLVDAGGYAKSTVSNAMRTMERLHFVHRRSVPGEGKKAYYEAERDFWRILQEFLRHEVVREIEIMSRALDDAAAKLEAADSAQAERDLEKIRGLQRIYGRSERLVETLNQVSFERLEAWLKRLVD
ncbi:GbsR/MarR family transcriptional regulator [Halobacteriales archaeon Cl-PHB]